MLSGRRKHKYCQHPFYYKWYELIIGKHCDRFDREVTHDANSAETKLTEGVTKQSNKFKTLTEHPANMAKNSFPELATYFCRQFLHENNNL